LFINFAAKNTKKRNANARNEHSQDLPSLRFWGDVSKPDSGCHGANINESLVERPLFSLKAIVDHIWV